MESPQAAMLTRITRFIILAPLEGDLHSISFSKMNKNTEIRMHQLHNLPLTHVDMYFISFQNQLKSFPYSNRCPNEPVQRCCCMTSLFVNKPHEEPCLFLPGRSGSPGCCAPFLPLEYIFLRRQAGYSCWFAQKALFPLISLQTGYQYNSRARIREKPQGRSWTLCCGALLV